MSNSTNIDPSMRCAKCGALLTNGGSCLACDTHISNKQADALAEANRFSNFNTSAPDTGRIPLPGADVIPPVRPKVCLLIGTQTVQVPFEEEVVIGRMGKNSPTKQPDVDLSAFDAEHKGVSRLHVRLQWRDGITFITDLNSTNGTRLNNRRLVGGGERPLRDGDTLHLGSLQVIVKFDSNA